MNCKIIFLFVIIGKKPFWKIICKRKGKNLQRQTAKITKFSEKSLNVVSWMWLMAFCFVTFKNQNKENFFSFSFKKGIFLFFIFYLLSCDLFQDIYKFLKMTLSAEWSFFCVKKWWFCHMQNLFLEKALEVSEIFRFWNSFF